MKLQSNIDTNAFCAIRCSSKYRSFSKIRELWYSNMSLRCNRYKKRSLLMKHCSCNNPPWFHQMLWLAKMCILLIQTQFDLLINCNRLSSHYTCNWTCGNWQSTRSYGQRTGSRASPHGGLGTTLQTRHYPSRWFWYQPNTLPWQRGPGLRPIGPVPVSWPTGV